MLIVKVGGGKNINWDYVCRDFAKLSEPAILVHGGNYEMDRVTKELGKEVKTFMSPSGFESRYSDRKTMEIFTMVYCGLVNKKIVAKLRSLGVNAVGLSGIDGGLWEGEKKKAVVAVENGKKKIIRDNYFIKVKKVNSRLLNTLIKAGFVPVITAPGISFEGEISNLDNDRAIAVMAKGLNVKRIVSLFEAPGVLADVKDEGTIINSIPKEGLKEVLKKVEGRMKKKILGAIEAFENGVTEMYLGDGRIKEPIKVVLKGEGTVIK